MINQHRPISGSIYDLIHGVDKFHSAKYGKFAIGLSKTSNPAQVSPLIQAMKTKMVIIEIHSRYNNLLVVGLNDLKMIMVIMIIVV